MRDRLIELLKLPSNCMPHSKCESCGLNGGCSVQRQADKILEDGWIRLPCKVGDTVWHIDIVGFGKNMLPIRKVVPFVVPDLEWILTMYFNFSRFYYPTKEEAEQALKGGA